MNVNQKNNAKLTPLATEKKINASNMLIFIVFFI
jgi:hypothetical protein